MPWIFYEEPPSARAKAMAAGLAMSVENVPVFVCSGSHCYQGPAEGPTEPMPHEGVLILHSSDSSEFLARNGWLTGLAEWPGIVIRFSAAKTGPTGLGIRRAIETGQEVQVAEWRELADWVEAGADLESLPGILGGFDDDQLCQGLLSALWLYQLKVASNTINVPIEVVSSEPICHIARRIVALRNASEEAPLPPWSGRLDVTLRMRLRPSEWSVEWRNRLLQGAGLDHVLAAFAASPTLNEEEIMRGIEFVRDDLIGR